MKSSIVERHFLTATSRGPRQPARVDINLDQLHELEKAFGPSANALTKMEARCVASIPELFLRPTDLFMLRLEYSADGTSVRVCGQELDIRITHRHELLPVLAFTDQERVNRFLAKLPG